MHKTQQVKRLIEKINSKKNCLIKISDSLELTDYRVIKCSQELDKLINLYLKRKQLHLVEQLQAKSMGEMRYSGGNLNSSIESCK